MKSFARPCLGWTACGAVLLLGVGCAQLPVYRPVNLSAWDTGPDATQRFIPVELWTGATWDGGHTLVMNPAKLAFGSNAQKTIVGPLAWTRPGTDAPIQVYQRDNKGKQQLFTMSSRGDGLGRVFDSRYGRDCVDEVKFPLGYWHRGETRTFDVSCNNGSLQRTIVLTIENLDFSYEGVAHSLQFHWVVDGGKYAGMDMHYIYSPGRGLVTVDGD